MEKKSNKNLTVLKIKCNILHLPPLGYSLGRLTYNIRVHKMADTLMDPALEITHMRERTHALTPHSESLAKVTKNIILL